MKFNIACQFAKSGVSKRLEEGFEKSDEIVHLSDALADVFGVWEPAVEWIRRRIGSFDHFRSALLIKNLSEGVGFKSLWPIDALARLRKRSGLRVGA